MFEFSIGLVVKLLTLLVAALGAICGLVRWFILDGLHKFTFHGFATGCVVIFLNAMLATSEIITLQIEDNYAYIQTPIGKAIQLFLIGLIFGGAWGLSIALWVIYWMLAVGYLVIYFLDVELARPFLSTGTGVWNPLRSGNKGEEGTLVKPIGGGSYAPLE
jgi:hypothetical protein